MTLSKKTAPVPTGMAHTMTQVVGDGTNDHTVDPANKNVRSGPATLYGVVFDNTVTASGAEWLKMYNVVDDTLVAGTSKPVLIIPAIAIATNPVSAGMPVVFIPGGVGFSEGISLLVSGEAGDAVSSVPAQATNVFLVTD